jgi:hypothetical protein
MHRAQPSSVSDEPLKTPTMTPVSSEQNEYIFLGYHLRACARRRRGERTALLDDSDGPVIAAGVRGHECEHDVIEPPPRPGYAEQVWGGVVMFCAQDVLAFLDALGIGDAQRLG